jgi:hypothetical protein
MLIGALVATSTGSRPPVWIAVALPGNLYVSVVKAEAFE